MTTGFIILICAVILIGFLMEITTPHGHGPTIQPPPDGPPPDDPSELE